MTEVQGLRAEPDRGMGRFGAHQQLLTELHASLVALHMQTEARVAKLQHTLERVRTALGKAEELEHMLTAAEKTLAGLEDELGQINELFGGGFDGDIRKV